MIPKYSNLPSPIVKQNTIVNSEKKKVFEEPDEDFINKQYLITETKDVTKKKKDKTNFDKKSKDKKTKDNDESLEKSDVLTLKSEKRRNSLSSVVKISSSGKLNNRLSVTEMSSLRRGKTLLNREFDNNDELDR